MFLHFFFFFFIDFTKSQSVRKQSVGYISTPDGISCLWITLILQTLSTVPRFETSSSLPSVFEEPKLQWIIYD
jgi:hypothetical protein